jgi:hypothetical protein
VRTGRDLPAKIGTPPALPFSLPYAGRTQVSALSISVG